MYYEGAERYIDCGGISGREGRWDELSTLGAGTGWGFEGFFVEMKSEKPQLKFQQDNAPSHRSKSTMKWFKKSSTLLLFHPPSSPDLSPIEPVWHELKKALWALPHLPTTIQELRAAILSVWDMVLIEDVDNHINRMHDHVELFWPQREAIPDSSSCILFILD